MSDVKDDTYSVGPAMAALPEIKKENKRKRRKLKRREAKIYAGIGKMTPPQTNELAGLDAYKCCDACNVDRCVITEAPFCGHPFKSPLQPMFMLNPKVVSRYNKAKAYLSGQSIDPGRL